MSGISADRKLEAIVADEWRKIRPFFSLLDFSRRPGTKAAWIVRFLAIVAASFFLVRQLQKATAPLLTAKPPAPIPNEEIEDYRFKIPERTRRAIFAELAVAELAERERALKANSWNGMLWSREDDRGHQERMACRAMAAKYHVSLSQVYLVLDEAIRNHWEGPDGKPLTPLTPPLAIRSTW